MKFVLTRFSAVIFFMPQEIATYMCRQSVGLRLLKNYDVIFSNPHLPNGPVHPYQLEGSISYFRGCLVYFLTFILF